jgi:hypothetical protein
LGLHAQVVAEVQEIKAMSLLEQAVAAGAAMVPAASRRALLATLVVTAQLKATGEAPTPTEATSVTPVDRQAAALEASATQAGPLEVIRARVLTALWGGLAPRNMWLAAQEAQAVTTRLPIPLVILGLMAMVSPRIITAPPTAIQTPRRDSLRGREIRTRARAVAAVPIVLSAFLAVTVVRALSSSDTRWTYNG